MVYVTLQHIINNYINLYIKQTDTPMSHFLLIYTLDPNYLEYEIIPQLNMISVLLIHTTVLLTVTAQSKS